MTTPVFLHIFETERECLHGMSELFEFFQYYPDTTCYISTREIHTPVMKHLFRTVDQIQFMQGVRVVGFKVSRCCDLTEHHEGFLLSIVRPTPWPKKG